MNAGSPWPSPWDSEKLFVRGTAICLGNSYLPGLLPSPEKSWGMELNCQWEDSISTHKCSHCVNLDLDGCFFSQLPAPKVGAQWHLRGWWNAMWRREGTNKWDGGGSSIAGCQCILYTVWWLSASHRELCSSSVANSSQHPSLCCFLLPTANSHSLPPG